MEGEFTVLPGHAPVISTLRPGVIEATLGDGARLACSCAAALPRSVPIA